MSDGSDSKRRGSLRRALATYRWPLLVAVCFTLLASTVPFALGGQYSPPRLTTFAPEAEKYSYQPLGTYPLASGCGRSWAQGVSEIPAGRAERVANDPAAIAQRGLDCHAVWMSDHDQASRQRVIHFADRLVDLQDTSGAWYFRTRKSLGPGVRVEAPSASATAQGLALSLLSRAYRASGRTRYLQAARRGLRPFERTFDRGGLRTRFLHGGTWYDGYAHNPPVYVLSSFLTALVGLSDLAAADPDSGARKLFLDGARTLPHSLRYFDTGQSQLYWLYHVTQKKPIWAASAVPCGSHWAFMDTYLLGALQSVHPNQWVRFFRDSWARDLDLAACKPGAQFSLSTAARFQEHRQRTAQTTYDPRGAYLLGWVCPKTATDTSSIPTSDYQGHTYHNVGTVALTGLLCYSSWVVEKDRQGRAAAVRMANWLVQDQDGRSGAWRFPFAYNGLFEMKPGYASSYLQGAAMSLLIRVYSATGDPKYRHAALLALKPLQRSIADGGLQSPFLGRGVWFEGYPHRPVPYTLDNFMYALIGLYDVSKVVPGSPAGKLFRDGYATLVRALPYFDAGNTSLFWLYHITQPRPLTWAWRNDCTSYEQSVLILELAALNSIRPNPWLAFYHDLWQNQMRHPKCL